MCPWPAGVHSTHLSPCISKGFFYSKQLNKCYLKAPLKSPKCNLLHKCSIDTSEYACGHGWLDECSITCKGQCTVSPIDESELTSESPEHFICTTEGEWINAVTEFPKRKNKITFDEGNLFREDTPFAC